MNWQRFWYAIRHPVETWREIRDMAGELLMLTGIPRKGGDKDG